MGQTKMSRREYKKTPIGSFVSFYKMPPEAPAVTVGKSYAVVDKYTNLFFFPGFLIVNDRGVYDKYLYNWFASSE